MLLDDVLNHYLKPIKLDQSQNTSNNVSLKKWKDNDSIQINLFEESGVTGTEIFSGIINEEYLTEWKDLNKRCKLITRMLKSDATVRAVYLVVTLPIESAKWTIKFDGDMDDKDKFIKDYCEKMLFDDMTITWQSFIRQVLSFVAYGFSLFEVVYELDKENNVAKIRKLAPRLQKTIKKWIIDETGGLAGIEQQAYFVKGNTTNYKTVRIGVDKLVLFTHRQEGSNFEGDSILRSAYKHWFIKDKLYLIQAIGLERFALGVPVIYLPKGATPEDKEYAKHIVRSWRSLEGAGMVLPDTARVDHIEGRYKEGPIQAAIEEHDRAILRSVLASFLSLGSHGVGSWALSRDQSDLFLMSLNSITKTISDTMNRYVIKPWVDRNFGKRKTYPQLVCENISKMSNTEVLQSLSILMRLGLIEKSEELVNWAYNRWDLPRGEMSLSEFLNKYGYRPEELEGVEEPQEGVSIESSQGNGKAYAPKPLSVRSAGSIVGSSSDLDTASRGVIEEGSAADGTTLRESRTPGSRKLSSLLNNYKNYLLKHNKSVEQPVKSSRGYTTYKLDEDTSDLDNDLDKLPTLEELANSDYISEEADSVIDREMRELSRDISRGEDVTSTTSLRRIADEAMFKAFKSLKSDLLRVRGVTSKRIDDAMHYVVLPVLNKEIDNLIQRLRYLMVGFACGGLNGITSFINSYVHNNTVQKFYDNYNYDPDGEHREDIDNITSDHDDMYESDVPISGFVGGAPTIIDPKTKRRKYAKGAVVGGKHVGGQWAPTRFEKMLDILGVGATLGGVASIALTNFRRALGRELKGEIHGKMRRFFDDLIRSSPTLRKLFLWRFVGEPYSFDQEGRLGTSDYAPINNIFDLEAPTAMYNGRNLGRRLSEVGLERDPDEWNRELRIRFYMMFRQEDMRTGRPMGEKMDMTHILWKVLNVDTEKTLDRHVKKPDGTIRGVPFHEFLDNQLRAAENNKQLFKLFRADLQPSSAEYKTILEILKEHEINPKDLLRDIQTQVAFVQSEKTASKNLSNRPVRIWRVQPGGIDKVGAMSIITGISMVLFSSTFNKLFNRVIAFIRHVGSTVSADLTTPEEIRRYNAAIEEWERMKSPTGGRVGRPRLKPELPSHLKRKPGRPSASETAEEEERKRKIKEYIEAWQRERGIIS